MRHELFLLLDTMNVIAMYDVFDLEMRPALGCPPPAWTTTVWLFIGCAIQLVACLDPSRMGRLRRAAFAICFLMGGAQRAGVLRTCEPSLWTAVASISIVFLVASAGQHLRWSSASLSLPIGREIATPMDPAVVRKAIRI